MLKFLRSELWSKQGYMLYSLIHNLVKPNSFSCAPVKATNLESIYTLHGRRYVPCEALTIHQRSLTGQCKLIEVRLNLKSALIIDITVLLLGHGYRIFFLVRYC